MKHFFKTILASSALLLAVSATAQTNDKPAGQDSKPQVKNDKVTTGTTDNKTTGTSQKMAVNENGSGSVKSGKNAKTVTPENKPKVDKPKPSPVSPK